jgi:hypothetical protein
VSERAYLYIPKGKKPRNFMGLEAKSYSTINTPASAEAVLERIARTSYARDVAAVPEDTRLTLGQEVCAALQAYRDGDHFVLPCKNHLVQARVA